MIPHSRTITWILFLPILGVVRGVLFFDYTFTPNIIILPVITPLFFALLAGYLFSTYKLPTGVSTIWGGLSLYLSSIVGMIVYGYTKGWDDIMNDPMSQIIFTAMLAVQTVIYVLCIALLIRHRQNLRAFFKNRKLR